MKFGTKVLVFRGSNHHAMNLRVVPGRLIGALGKQRLVKLDFYDGPHDSTTDEVYGIWFSDSAVCPFDFPLRVPAYVR